MNDDRRSRPRLRAVPVEEPFPTRDHYDYADAFEVRLSEPDHRTAEQWARCALEQAPWIVRRTVLVAHRYVLRFRLGPLSSPDHVLGWTVVRSRPDLVCLQADSALISGVIVGRRPHPTRTVLTTFVVYRRRWPARVIWALVAPIHRRVARSLPAHAAVGDRSSRV